MDVNEVEDVDLDELYGGEEAPAAARDEEPVLGEASNGARGDASGGASGDASGSSDDSFASDEAEDSDRLSEGIPEPEPAPLGPLTLRINEPATHDFLGEGVVLAIGSTKEVAEGVLSGTSTFASLELPENDGGGGSGRTFTDGNENVVSCRDIYPREIN